MTSKLRSFDIFDTAIIRKVYHPKDIFKLIEDKVGNDFYKKRVQAEEFARQKNKYYTLKDIYKYLDEFDINIEIDTEFDNCIANPDIINLYSPVDSVFISDMYLPSKVLKKILENAGYINPEVYVSCEMKAYKADGKLFKKVEKKTGRHIGIHYGDNYVADIEGARLAGVDKVIFKPALHNKNLNLPKVKNTYLKKYLAIIEDKAEPLQKLALFYTPVMVGFTKWILNNRASGQKIFFLSRDMHMPYVIAKYILNADNVFYIHVSRRSLAGVCINSKDKELLKKMSYIFTKEELKELKKKDNSEAINYLKQLGIRNNDIIADIGYAGTIQAGINHALNINTQGLYLQVSSKVLSGLNTKMFLNRMVVHFCLMVEFVFGSPEDNIEGYKDGKPVFVPDNDERKKLAREIESAIYEAAKIFCEDSVSYSVYDLEQILIHQQYYPNNEIINIYNKKIFSNREKKESIIGFDRDEILNGNIRSLYMCSYCQPLFRELLNQDKELKHLSKLLP